MNTPHSDLIAQIERLRSVLCTMTELLARQERRAARLHQAEQIEVKAERLLKEAARLRRMD